MLLRRRLRRRLNGLLITWLNVAPFIATLGTLYVARGAGAAVSDGSTFPNLVGKPDFGTTGYGFLGAGRLLGLPVSIWLLILVALAAAYFARFTPLGRHIFTVGGNERAAALSGISVTRVKMFVYMFSGFCAAIVGLVVSSELMASHPGDRRKLRTQRDRRRGAWRHVDVGRARHHRRHDRSAPSSSASSRMAW